MFQKHQEKGTQDGHFLLSVMLVEGREYIRRSQYKCAKHEKLLMVGALPMGQERVSVQWIKIPFFVDIHLEVAHVFLIDVKNICV